MGGGQTKPRVERRKIPGQVAGILFRTRGRENEVYLEKGIVPEVNAFLALSRSFSLSSTLAMATAGGRWGGPGSRARRVGAYSAEPIAPSTAEFVGMSEALFVKGAAVNVANKKGIPARMNASVGGRAAMHDQSKGSSLARGAGVSVADEDATAALGMAARFEPGSNRS